MGALDRRAPEPDGGAGPLPPARGRRLGPRRARPAPSTIRRRTRRCSPRWSDRAPDRARASSSACRANINDPAFAAAAVGAFRALHGGRAPRAGGRRGERCPASSAPLSSRNSAAWSRAASRSSAAAPAPGSRPSARRRAASTSSSSTTPAATAWPAAARSPACMPYGDANAIVVEMAAEVLPVVRRTPVLAGVNGTDPFRLMDVFLDELKAHRLLRRPELPDRRPDRRRLPRQPRRDRHVLRARGRHDRQGPRQGPADDALRVRRGRRGGDGARPAPTSSSAISGLTTGGSIGAETALKLADCPALVDAWAEAALRVKRDVIVLVHGGPVAEPEDAAFILRNTSNCHGFYGASSMERLPVEVALDGADPQIQGDRAPARERAAAEQAASTGGHGHVGCVDREPDPLAHRRGHRHRDRRLLRELALPPLVEGGRPSSAPASSASGW